MTRSPTCSSLGLPVLLLEFVVRLQILGDEKEKRESAWSKCMEERLSEAYLGGVEDLHRSPVKVGEAVT